MQKVIAIGLGILFASAGLPGSVLSVERGDEFFIAGTAPNQRPQNAPVIDEFTRPDGWYDRALKGITPPYPHSLRFLEDQGAWYTPFNQPGMTGRYDMRGLMKK